MVLAAGLGTRLRPLTDRLPKPLVPLLNRPLVERPLALLRAAGVTEVVLNLHHLPDALPAALGDGGGLGLQLSYSREEGELLGTGGGVARAADWLTGADSPGTAGHARTFLVLNGDAVVEVDLRAVVAAHRAAGVLATLVLRADSGGRFPPLEHDGAGRLLSIPAAAEGPGAQHPSAPAARAAGAARRAMFTGVHVVEPAALEALPRGGAACLLRQGYGPLLAAGARFGAYVLPETAFFSDVGTPAAYLGCSRALLSGGEGPGPLVDPTASVAAGAAIDAGTTVAARARVAAGVRLRGCIVWPDTDVAADHDDAILAPDLMVDVR
jgi:mannose-1-phosphate guanylyltransferase